MVEIPKEIEYLGKAQIEFYRQTSPIVWYAEGFKRYDEISETNEKYDQQVARPTTEANKKAQAELDQMKAGGVSKSDELLRCGLGELKFFDQFLPLYNEWKGSNLDLQRDIYDEYGKFWGIDFMAFRRDIESLSQSSSTMEHAYSALNTELKSLVTHWQGQAAATATNHISKVLESGHEFQENVTNLRDNLKHHSEGIEKIIRNCAEATLEIYSPDCAGIAPRLVKELIGMARGDTNLPGWDNTSFVVNCYPDTLKSVLDKSPVAGPVSDVIMSYFKETLNCAVKMLNDRFVPAFESKLQKFQDIVCKKTTDDLHHLWSEFTDSAKNIPKEPFAGTPLLLA